jgi:hypothetical protein
MQLLSARFIISLVVGVTPVGVTLVSLCSSGYEVLVGKRNLRRGLQRRAEVLGGEPGWKRRSRHYPAADGAALRQSRELKGTKVSSPSYKSARRAAVTSSDITTWKRRSKLKPDVSTLDSRRINGRPSSCSSSSTLTKRSSPTTKPRICAWSLSLHDGMNLAAKEFVAARGDERGVLVLSILAGRRGSCATRFRSIITTSTRR